MLGVFARLELESVHIKFPVITKSVAQALEVDFLCEEFDSKMYEYIDSTCLCEIVVERDLSPTRKVDSVTVIPGDNVQAQRTSAVFIPTVSRGIGCSESSDFGKLSYTRSE